MALGGLALVGASFFDRITDIMLHVIIQAVAAMGDVITYRCVAVGGKMVLCAFATDTLDRYSGGIGDLLVEVDKVDWSLMGGEVQEAAAEATQG